jgi:hypothetical protein
LYAAALLYDGKPQVWYQALPDGTLRHAWWSGAVWFFETLDGAGAPGGNGRTTELVGSYNAVLLYAGQPHVWYQDEDAGTLRHAWWSGSAWFFETLDGAGAPGGNGRVADAVGQYNAVIIYAGQPHVWYEDTASFAGTLRHAWWTGSSWAFETLDGENSPGGNRRTSDIVGSYVVVDLDQGQPHLWYDDETTHTRRHAWWSGEVWFFEAL